MSDLTGHTLGPYRLVEQAGAGGMATVYKAYHAAMDRYVAIKVLPQHLARDPSFRARFQREARTIARLQHRSILPVHDVAEDNGVPYLVMRYVDSGTLADLIAGRAAPFEQTVRIVSEVGEALGYAHRQGVIHRDVKPANVLLDRDGGALLTDFGIAKIFEDTLQLTSEGAMIGTPAYMAPEQLQGQPVDARSNIYALGVVLYQAMTGECPFVAETPLAVALMHIHNPLRPPRQINRAIPESLERVVLRAMAKNPADRFQTADEMVEALRAAPLPQATPASPPPVSVAPLPASLPPAYVTPPPISPATPPPASLPPAYVTPPPVSPAPATPLPAAPRRLRPIWLAAGLGVVALLILAAFVLPRLGQAPVGPSQAGAPTVAAGAGTISQLPAGPTMVPPANLRVLSNGTQANRLAALGDTVWAATQGGLVRYRGDEAPRIFTVADGLPFNAATTIAAAPDGVLWVGSYGQIARVRPVADGLGEVTLYDEGLDIGELHTFMIDGDGSVWAGGANGGSRFDGQKWAPPPSVSTEDPVLKTITPDIRSLLRASDGTLWAGLAEGLLRWDGSAWARIGTDQGVEPVTIYQLLQDRAGTIWAVTGGQGLLRLTAGQERWEQVSLGDESSDLRAIAELADGRLWVSSDGGIAQLAAGGTAWEMVTAPEQFLGWAGSGSIAQDASGQIWLAGGAGVSALRDGQWRFVNSASPLPFTSVGRLLGAGDGLWAIEQYGGAAAKIDPATLAVEPFTQIEGRITMLAQAEDATWVGTLNGLFRLRGGATLRLTTADGLPSDQIFELLLTPDTLWIGTAAGLASYNLETEQVSVVEDFNGGAVASLLLAPDGAVWAGSLRLGDVGFGLLGRFDGESWQLWRQGDLPSPEDPVEVVALTVDAEGQIWMLTWGGGVHTWDGAAWKSWTEADGAPNGSALALTLREGEVWVGGQFGPQVFRWNQDGWSQVAVAGLSGYVNAMHFTPDGALWLGTTEGLLRYQP